MSLGNLIIPRCPLRAVQEANVGLDDKLVRKKLEVFLRDNALVEKYLQTYGTKLDMANVEKIKQAALESAPPKTGGAMGSTAPKPAVGVAAGVKNSTPSAAGAGVDEEPLYQIKVKCPICNQADITCYELKAKSLTTKADRFMIPRYEGVKGFKSLNFSLISVTVCPRCLFASPDKKDFITFSIQARTENKSQLGPFLIEEIRKRENERKTMLEGITDYAAYFTYPRKVESGVASYKMAINRALAEASLENPLSLYKAGMYSLKIALIMRDLGKDDEEICKKAVAYLSKSFRASEVKTPELEYQLVYTVCALFLRLGEQTQCQAFMGVLDKKRGELDKLAKEDPSVNTALIDKWIEKSKDMWTDREDPDLWKH